MRNIIPVIHIQYFSKQYQNRCHQLKSDDNRLNQTHDSSNPPVADRI